MNDHRLAYHMDSWIALAITLAALVIAIGLSHRSARVRAYSTALAAIACGLTVLWLFFTFSTGIMENPRPALFPTDGIKPTVLYVQAGLFALACVFLIGVSRWQLRSTNELDLPLTNSTDKFGRLSRCLHWTTAILIIALVPMGIFTSMIPEDLAWRQGYYVVHKTVGIVALILLAVRVLWHLFGSRRPGLDSDLKPWERFLAHVVHGLLYVLMLMLPITGFVMSTYGGKLSHFFIWDLPLWWGEDLEAIKPWGLFHKLALPFLFYAIFLAHVLGALKHYFIDKHRESIHRMVS
ncbi:MAG: cytochrome b [Pseudomonadota bacterium]